MRGKKRDKSHFGVKVSAVERGGRFVCRVQFKAAAVSLSPDELVQLGEELAVCGYRLRRGCLIDAHRGWCAFCGEEEVVHSAGFDTCPACLGRA